MTTITSPAANTAGMQRPLGRLLSKLYQSLWYVLPPVVCVAMLAMLVGALVVAPREAVEGQVQRVFYIHMPSAIAMYVSFGIVLIASVLLLWTRDMRYDAVARSAATVGVLFTGFVLATGAIWGRPIWGTWWAWDARLTSTLVLFLLYIGYLLARSLADELDEQVARYVAVYGIIATLDIPVIYMSVQWWRTLHPQPILATNSLPSSMLFVVLLGVVAIVLLAGWLVMLRAETEQLGVRAAAMRAVLDRAEGD